MNSFVFEEKVVRTKRAMTDITFMYTPSSACFETVRSVSQLVMSVNITRIRSLTSVNNFVFFEITSLSEVFAAYLTFKWIITTVNYLMTDKCLLMFKGFVTHIAYEWFLIAMTTSVFNKMAHITKGLVALITSKRLFTSVNCLVFEKCLLIFKGFATNTAFE